MTQHTPTAVGLDDVFDIVHRLAEKPITSLIFDRKQPTLNHTDTRRRDLECQLQHALLGIVQVENARQTGAGDAAVPVCKSGQKLEIGLYVFGDEK